MPSSVTWPMTSAWISQRRKCARTSASCSFLAMTSMRSCDSLSMTSAGRHARLAPRHQRNVDLDAGVAARRALDQRAGQAGGAAVLQPDDPVGVLLRQLDAGLHQQLLEEGVAHLHRRPQLLLPRLEGARGQHVGAADAVAARIGADEDDRVADAGRDRAQQLVAARHADAHRVDQRVAVVGVGERDLAAHGRHAQAVAVAADARHDAPEQRPVAATGAVSAPSAPLRVCPQAARSAASRAARSAARPSRRCRARCRRRRSPRPRRARPPRGGCATRS